MKKVLITGANGFVGSRLANTLEHDFEVYGLDKVASKPQRDKFIACDLTAPASIKKAIQHMKFDYVVHCAAIAHNDDKVFTDEDFFRVNVGGTKNLIEHFTGSELQLFVLFSTVAVYGERDYVGEVSEQYPLRPCTAYGQSKLLAEHACLSNPDFAATILRFPPIYDRGFVKDLCKRISPVTDKIRIQIGAGSNQYSLCAVQNACDAVKFVLEHPQDAARRVFNVTDPDRYTHTELRHELDLVVGHRPCVRMPRVVIAALAGLGGVFMKKRKEQLRSIYWKLAEDNVYSSQAIRDMGFRPVATLHDLASQPTKSDIYGEAQ